MSSGFNVDDSDVRDLIRDIQRTVDVTPAKVRSAIQVSSLKVKTQARENAARIAGKHARIYPYSITYDTVERRGDAEGFIGPDKDLAQGALGNLLEFGSSNNPPHPHLGPALEAETAGFLSAMERIAVGEL